jgi:hypothetical protein
MTYLQLLQVSERLWSLVCHANRASSAGDGGLCARSMLIDRLSRQRLLRSLTVQDVRKCERVLISPVQPLSLQGDAVFSVTGG